MIDLSGIGFQPKTFISSGIMLYGSKLLKNVSALIGIGSNISTEDKAKIQDALENKISEKVDKTIQNIEKSDPVITPNTINKKEDSRSNEKKEDISKQEETLEKCESCEYKKSKSPCDEKEVVVKKTEVKEEKAVEESVEEFTPDPNAVG